jgi:endonuclease YncB( thermonuclease family)
MLPGLSRGLALPLTILLAMLAPPSVRAADSASVIGVVDSATLDVALSDSTQRVQLAGIDVDANCSLAVAAARVHELVDGQAVSLETDSALSEQDQLGRRFVYVWLPDGRDLGQVLLSEGLVRAQLSAVRLAHEDSFAAAQAAAADQRLGAWAPGACPVEVAPAGVESFVKAAASQAQVASTAVSVLHQQTISAAVSPSALSQAGWRQGTAYAVAELHRAGSALASASPGGPVQPLAERFARIGGDLVVGADAYGAASELHDLGLMQSQDDQLAASITALQPLMQELVTYGLRYSFED